MELSEARLVLIFTSWCIRGNVPVKGTTPPTLLGRVVFLALQVAAQEDKGFPLASRLIPLKSLAVYLRVFFCFFLPQAICNKTFDGSVITALYRRNFMRLFSFFFINFFLNNFRLFRVS